MAVRQRPEPRFPGGLEGQWVSVEELAELELFKSGKRAFKVKINTNFAPQAGKPEPGIKAAVRREYQPGQVICSAGEYGSTAFLPHSQSAHNAERVQNAWFGLGMDPITAAIGISRLTSCARSLRRPS